jgi:hypothetical protein
MAARLSLPTLNGRKVCAARPARRVRLGAVRSTHLKNTRRGTAARLGLGLGGSAGCGSAGRSVGSARVQADRGSRIVAGARLGGLLAGWPVIGVTATSADQRRASSEARSGRAIRPVAGRWPVTSDNRSNVKSPSAGDPARKPVAASRLRQPLTFVGRARVARERASERASVPACRRGGEGGRARAARAHRIRSMRLKFYRQMGP